MKASKAPRSPIAWKARKPLSQQIPLIEEWYDTELGQAFLAAEKLLVAEALHCCFGYHLLQLGMSRRHFLADNCTVQHCTSVAPLALEAKNFGALAEFHQLPFASDSIDVVIAHHLLDFVDNPHQVLRELQRVLVPNGRLILIGCNPYSLLTLQSTIGRLSGKGVWNNHLLTARRCLDWLSLLGFEQATIKYGFHRPPTQSNKILRNLKVGPRASAWLQKVPLGSVYVIDVVKQLVPGTPIRTRKLRSLTSLVDIPLAQPAPSRFGRSAKVVPIKSLPKEY